MTALGKALLALHNVGYRWGVRPVLFRTSAANAHKIALAVLRWLDNRTWTHPLLRTIHAHTAPQQPVTVGGVVLPHPIMIAAGLVKGEAFENESAALDAANTRNIIAGWRSLPLLVGAVEFGSFTRHPRLGNAGVTMWRDVPTASTQNRVGLKNPGAIAAAAFLAKNRAHLPPIFGINIAPSPAVDDITQSAADIETALNAFIERDIIPSWFTLNISCPNTEDDPEMHQTETLTRALVERAQACLSAHGVPLWVKIGPSLSAAQYRCLAQIFHANGVAAVIAVNTLAQPAPTGEIAGVGGGKLNAHALETVRAFASIRHEIGANFDIIGCGGVQDGASARALQDAGASAMQIWSALVYRGLLAPAAILNKSR